MVSDGAAQGFGLATDAILMHDDVMAEFTPRGEFSLGQRLAASEYLVEAGARHGGRHQEIMKRHRHPIRNPVV